MKERKWKKTMKKSVVWMVLMTLVVGNLGVSVYAAETSGNAVQGGPPAEGEFPGGDFPGRGFPGGFPGSGGFPGGAESAEPMEGDIVDIVLNVGATDDEVQVTWYSKSETAKIQVKENDGEYTEYSAESKDSGYTAVYEIETEAAAYEASTIEDNGFAGADDVTGEGETTGAEDAAGEGETTGTEDVTEEGKTTGAGDVTEEGETTGAGDVTEEDETTGAEELTKENDADETDTASETDSNPTDEGKMSLEDPVPQAAVLDVIFVGEGTTVTTADSDSAETEEVTYYSHTVKLTGLNAGSSYRYKVSGINDADEEIWSDEHVYTVKDTSERLEFLVVGDPQIGSSSTEKDSEKWADTMSAALEKFSNASFLLSVGDQINSAGNANKAEQNFMGFLTEDSMLSSLPIATSVGNHDNSHAQAYTSHFALPNVSGYGSTSDDVSGEEDYSFVRGNVLFMMLNTNNSSIAEHKEFIEKTIAANQDCTWRVAAFHQSIYSVARHVNDGNIAALRTGLSPVFVENDIDVVLMGHDHVYARSYIMGGETGIEAEIVRDVNSENNQALTTLLNPDGVQYITFNSASGSKYYDITQELFTYTAVQNQEKSPNYSHVSVDENSFSVTTYRMDGSIVDTITLMKGTETGLEETETVAAEEKTEGFYNEEAAVRITKTAGYNSGIVNKDGGSAEIIQYNSDTQMYYVVNGTSGTLDIVPRAESAEKGIKFNLKDMIEAQVEDFTYGDMTSVAISTEKDLVAAAVQAEGTNDPGLIVLMDYHQNIKAIIEAGVQPDMVTFTKDGNKVLSANEGEPRDGYGEGTVDPMGTITVADLSHVTDSDTGFDTISVQKITFENWDEKREELIAAGVIIKKNTDPSVDFEPEYIAVNDEGTKAYVALQEANAIAAIDLTKNEVVSVKSLGFKDHSLEENALDYLKKDEAINIQTADYYGIYMPDGISIYEVNGTEYLVTANEGDSREWGDYLNEIEEKVGQSKSKVVFFDTSDYDGLDADKKYLFGARSFAIYNAETMEQIYESGSDFETITAQNLPDYFNCSNDDKSLDDRSGKKGPEPESVVVGEISGKTYAFIGVERIGGIMVYDITDPANSSFVNYINSRDFSDNIAGDVSPEGLCFVSASQSLSGKAELLAAHEVSGTVAIYEMTAQSGNTQDNTDHNQNGSTGGSQGSSGSSNNKDSSDDSIDGTSLVQIARAGSSMENAKTSAGRVSTGDTQNAALWSVILVSVAVMIGGIWLINHKKVK